MADKIDHPSHYNNHPSGVECIQVTEYMTFSVGNAVKYLWRSGQKAGETALDDLKKARWYIDREIQRLERESGGGDADCNNDPPKSVPTCECGRAITKAAYMPSYRGLAYATAVHPTGCCSAFVDELPSKRSASRVILELARLGVEIVPDGTLGTVDDGLASDGK